MNGFQVERSHLYIKYRISGGINLINIDFLFAKFHEIVRNCSLCANITPPDFSIGSMQVGFLHLNFGCSNIGGFLTLEFRQFLYRWASHDALQQMFGGIRKGISRYRDFWEPLRKSQRKSPPKPFFCNPLTVVLIACRV